MVNDESKTNEIKERNELLKLQLISLSRIWPGIALLVLSTPWMNVTRWAFVPALLGVGLMLAGVVQTSSFFNRWLDAAEAEANAKRDRGEPPLELQGEAKEGSESVW